MDRHVAELARLQALLSEELSAAAAAEHAVRELIARLRVEAQDAERLAGVAEGRAFFGTPTETFPVGGGRLMTLSKHHVHNDAHKMVPNPFKDEKQGKPTRGRPHKDGPARYKHEAAWLPRDDKLFRRLVCSAKQWSRESMLNKKLEMRWALESEHAAGDGSELLTPSSSRENPDKYCLSHTRPNPKEMVGIGRIYMLQSLGFEKGSTVAVCGDGSDDVAEVATHIQDNIEEFTNFRKAKLACFVLHESSTNPNADPRAWCTVKFEQDGANETGVVVIAAICGSGGGAGSHLLRILRQRLFGSGKFTEIKLHSINAVFSDPSQTDAQQCDPDNRSTFTLNRWYRQNGFRNAQSCKPGMIDRYEPDLKNSMQSEMVACKPIDV